MSQGVRIYWEPAPDSDVERYEVYRGTVAGGVTLFDTVPHAVPGPNYDDKLARFYLDDTDAGTYVYRVVAVSQTGVAIGDTGVFYANSAQSVDLRMFVKVDHNYGLVDALRYVSPGGAGIPYAKVFVFKTADYAAGRRDAPVATTETLVDGRWREACYLTPGLDYTIVFFKQSEYGPNAVTVTVPAAPAP